MTRAWGRSGIVAATLLAASAAHGQGGTAITATAVVVTVGLTVATVSNLNFGTVVAGVPTSVAFTAPGAGALQVTGSPNAFVTMTFTLPALLTNIQAAPGSTMPITFGAADAGWRRANNAPAGATVFDPSVGDVGRLGPPPNPNLYIWIGGTVSPPAGAKPGIYVGTIILSLVYT